MEISINKFKSIKELFGFDIKPLTILSGVNSSGKSSFIQLLLILKQTIELNSSTNPLLLKGEFISIDKFEDVIYKKNIKKNELTIGFVFNKKDFDNIDKDRMQIFDYLDDYQCQIEIIYSYIKDKIYVNDFSVKYILPEGIKQKQFIQFSHKNGNIYLVKSNTGIFDKEIWERGALEGQINFNYFIPYAIVVPELLLEELKNEEIENINEIGFSPDVIKKGKKYYRKMELNIIPNLQGVKNVIEKFFKNMSYIGPLREEPRDDYYFKEFSQLKIGNKGENTALILESEARRKVNYYKIIENENNISFEEKNDTLANAVKYWICEVFDLAKNIKAKKYKDSYSIIIKDHQGLEVSIKHVGFGISQILPIIVEGLRMPKNGTLVLEQPEIHLHPKAQSLFFDFLYSLTLSGKRIIVETHSSHFITRLRRRVAENISPDIVDNINLTFIEKRNDEFLFQKLNLDGMGTLDYYPKDFIDLSANESRAIVKAQAIKSAK